MPTTTPNVPVNFQIGAFYKTRRATDHNQVLSYLVVTRTKCFVTLTDQYGHQVRVKVTTRGGVESVMPEGTYSMAPCLLADS